MILAGDEFGHTQQGNNNAYCQDNEISWLNLELDDDQKSLLQFVQRFIAFWARSAGPATPPLLSRSRHAGLVRQGHPMVQPGWRRR